MAKLKGLRPKGMVSYCLMGGFAVMIATAVAFGQTTQSIHHPVLGGRSKPPMGIPLAPPPNGWISNAWTGDSAPYDAVVREIRSSGVRDGDTKEAYKHLYEQAKREAKAQPTSLLAQFSWMYTAILVANRGDTFDYHAQDAVDRLDFGKFRTVARMRYAAVLVSERFTPHPELASLAERLMTSDPSDTWLRDRAIRDLANGRKTLPNAIVLADLWLTQAPNSAQVHGVRAYVAQTQWFWSGNKDRAAAKRTVLEYQDFLRLSSPTDPSRPDVERMVKGVSEMAGLTRPIR